MTDKHAWKIRIAVRSIPLLAELDEHIRRCGIEGPLSRFRDIASDCFDGAYVRAELDDLIRRRLLYVVRHGFDDSMGRDPSRDSDPKLCGVGWSVNPSDALVLALWPGRLHRPRPGDDQ